VVTAPLVAAVALVGVLRAAFQATNTPECPTATTSLARTDIASAARALRTDAIAHPNSAAITDIDAPSLRYRWRSQAPSPSSATFLVGLSEGWQRTSPVDEALVLTSQA
jgi:hypothetical protein